MLPREANGQQLCKNQLLGRIMVKTDKSCPTSFAGSCITERSNALTGYETTSRDAYSVKPRMDLSADPFARFQQAKRRNPQILSYNSDLAYLDNKFLDVDIETNQPMTTTSRQMNVRKE